MHNNEVKPNPFRRLSLFKTSSSSTTSPVLTTNTISKEYDAETGNKILNNYMILKEIGRGTHGKVKLAEDLDTGELVAIKIVDKQSRRRPNILRNNQQSLTISSESEQKIRREIAILKKCVHPNVVKLKEVIDDPSSRKIYLALEYLENGELIWREDEESNKPVLSMDESRSIFRDVVSGLDYLHYQGIIHRDIKPANLLLTHDNTVKISDFGVSYFNQHLAGTNHQHDNNEIDRELAETAGTPAFFAPELCNSEHQQVTKAIDVWALGVTLYCLVFGQCPFTAATEFELFDIIPTASLTFPFEIPDNLRDLLEKLLIKDPKERITLDQVKLHPWVIQDLSDPQAWWKHADPSQYQSVQVSDEEVSKAVTLLDRLRRSIKKTLATLSHPFHFHKQPIMVDSDATTLMNHQLYQEKTLFEDEAIHDDMADDDQNNGWIPKSFNDQVVY